MPDPKSRSPFKWFVLAVLLLGLLAVAFVMKKVPKAADGAKIAYLKATGALPDISWKDLYIMSGKQRHYSVPGLAKTPNPYAVITNPFSEPEDLAAGSQLFRSHCTVCHGPNGSGGPAGPPLQHRHMVQGDSDWALFRTVSFGIRGTAMPASTLAWDDRWRLVAFVRSLLLRAEVSGEMDDNSGVKPVAPVTFEQISAAQRGDSWLTYSGSYDGHRFSPNTQITPANASGLRLLWMHQYDTPELSVETSPIVVDGHMFVTLPPNWIEALDANTGHLIWSYERKLPDHLSVCCGYVNRGLAVLGDTLYLGTLDAHLIALDINTGKVLWDVEIANYKDGYSITSAPLIVKNMVITGVAGGEFGIRGFVQALDASTGKSLWKLDTIPQPGQPGADTWKGDGWKTGGGPTWLTGSYDVKSNVLYWPVGNPSPNFEGDTRAGANLYTNSMLALDADTGALKWHFQFTPHDLFDWDATEIPILFDATISGNPQHLLAQANRNGFFYLLDRDTGKFLLAKPFAQQTWAQSIDSEGRPTVNPNAAPTEHGTLVYPGVGGATNWESPSYSPSTGYFYVPALEWGGVFYKGAPDYHPGEMFLGGSFQFSSAVQPQGAVRAINPLTGERVWEYRNPANHVGGLLSTAGGVVFGSQQEFFFALDAKTGKELWRVATGGRVVAAPVSYMAGNSQRITIAAGHDILTFALPVAVSPASAKPSNP